MGEGLTRQMAKKNHTLWQKLGKPFHILEHHQMYRLPVLRKKSFLWTLFSSGTFTLNSSFVFFSSTLLHNNVLNIIRSFCKCVKDQREKQIDETICV